MDTLESISPIDGRYRIITEPLATIFTEKALINYRLKVECEYLIYLSEHPAINVRNFSNIEKELIRNLYVNFSLDDSKIIKDIENKGYKNFKATNHDIKAIEYFIKDKLNDTSLKDSLELVHFGLTSEDISNIAYGLMLSDALSSIIIPKIIELNKKIEDIAIEYREIPMLSRTHGQPASPTTFGKEFKVFSSRINNQLSQLSKYNISVKLNGATGNYNAHSIAYPQINWLIFTQDFVNKFNETRIIKLKPNFITTQIEPHDTYAELFDNLRRINTILINFNQDVWRYISDGFIIQKVIEGEIGSSTMPHKINPIDFENSEGNLGMANALFNYFSTKLPISRLQRDLSDSTVERNFGSALAYSLIAYESTLKGLNKIDISKENIIKELNNHPELISEAIQTILRREGISMAYEKLKELTRGKKVNINDINLFIEYLNVSERIKTELKNLTPENYIGIAKLICGL